MPQVDQNFVSEVQEIPMKKKILKTKHQQDHCCYGNQFLCIMRQKLWYLATVKAAAAATIYLKMQIHKLKNWQ